VLKKELKSGSRRKEVSGVMKHNLHPEQLSEHWTVSVGNMPAIKAFLPVNKEGDPFFFS
jgi:hypothetical protein